VLHSLDAEDSAAWIIRLAKRARRTGPTTPAALPATPPRRRR
jgi:DNA excision repair protein ERCC-4